MPTADLRRPDRAVVAIVGRPNVGKSTLFNRLVGRRLAIVDDTPGVTRDRREGEAQLGDLRFTVIDTAGFEDARGDHLAARIQAQTERALAGADVVLFLIDARAGVTPFDRELADLLRRTQLPVVLIANKSEGRAGEAGRAEAYALGLGEPLPLSAEHGEGLALLYDALQPALDALAARAGGAAGPHLEEPVEAAAEAEEAAAAADAQAPAPAEAPLQLAIVGRPNVGKSTLINRLVGDERLVTGPEAGITRDAIAVDWSWQGRRLRLFDTAGLRRRARIEDRLERLSGADTLRAIRFAHVVVLVADGAVGVERQDLTIADLVVEEGRALVLAVNKWDQVGDRRETLAAISDRLEQSLPQARGLRLVTLSALTGEGVDRLLPAVLAAHDVWTREIPTPRLNRWLAEATMRQPPPAARGRPTRIRYMTQTKARPPTFLLFANRPEQVTDTYLRYLANGLRDGFGLHGVPLRLTVRRSRNPYAD